jgi:hypothetical protein
VVSSRFDIQFSSATLATGISAFGVENLMYLLVALEVQVTDRDCEVAAERHAVSQTNGARRWTL